MESVLKVPEIRKEFTTIEKIQACPLSMGILKNRHRKKNLPINLLSSSLILHKQLYIKREALCFYCNVAVGDSRDHFIPRLKGGVNAWINAVPACKVCNEAKGCRWPTIGQLTKFRLLNPAVAIEKLFRDGIRPVFLERWEESEKWIYPHLTIKL